MDMTRRIWPSTLPERLLGGTIAGFDELEVLAVGKGFFVYRLFESFGGFCSIVPIYFEHDCLRKHKMAIFSILAGRVKTLYIFS